MGFCSCCGVEDVVYKEQGHDPECIWHFETTVKLAEEWLNDDNPEADWKKRYDLAVTFLLMNSDYRISRISSIRHEVE